ncbi:hypothetical protein D2T29_12580 [Sinirhodobacter populi]|uniref:Uncharacterized protein n=1 Tax=Paenirhodobacter populi TaxID=2306993 RepID=A0A443KCL5_9RHOB|nr:hypothetical protein [Sinirhodobacter populi]RWR30500.1 hypothetical protein D2T29_12580 [Sinirhodobacter populi]
MNIWTITTIAEGKPTVAIFGGAEALESQLRDHYGQIWKDCKIGDDLPSQWDEMQNDLVSMGFLTEEQIAYVQKHKLETSSQPHLR